MKEPFFVLAPMDDVTETVFRRVVHDCAPADLYMTEFVNVDGLCSPGRSRLMHKLDISQDNGDVIAQIWGRIPENFEAVAFELSNGDIPGFSGIDLNFGCPAKSEVKNECCSALQKFELRDKALAIIQATFRGAGRGKHDLPVSFKTRLGFDTIDFTWHEFLLKQKPSMLTVHVRTTREMSKVPAHWDAIEEIVHIRNRVSPNSKIVLNGDIMNRTQGLELAKKYNVDGIMIGRGVFQDPYCFSENNNWSLVTPEEKVQLFRKHLLLHQKTYQNGERQFSPLKKFAKIYISGFEGASEFRDKIMHTESIDQMLDTLKKQ